MKQRNMTEAQKNSEPRQHTIASDPDASLPDARCDSNKLTWFHGNSTAVEQM